MSDILRYYSDVCPDCDSWNVRILSEVKNPEHGWDIVVYCRDCGFEWNDFIEELD